MVDPSAPESSRPEPPPSGGPHESDLPQLGEPLADPLELTSAYVSRGVPSADALTYTRLGNRSWQALEAALGRLEGADALVFASGMAAIANLMLALADAAPIRTAASPRPQVVLPSDGYHGVRVLAAMLAARGIDHVTVDQRDLAAVESALAAAGPAPILWTETPTNPFLRVVDLAALARLAQAHGAPLVCDNTTATAALQLPLDLGATATVTSLTKAGSGHSDVVLGAVATRDPQLVARLSRWRAHGGAIAGPFETWLALRGLKTLCVRIERQSRTALALTRFLDAHPAVARVHYPGLDPATRALAERQMPHGAGPLLAFELAEGDERDADAVVARARVIRHATSFGGVSLMA